MKIVYVAGFFSPVLKKLEAALALEFETKSVVWIPQFANGDPDIRTFRARLFSDIAQGANDISLCLFLFRGKEYVAETLEAILQEATEKTPDLVYLTTQFKNAQDSDGLIRHIRLFSPMRIEHVPESLKDLESWVLENHLDRVVLHPRALKGLKNSRFLDTKLIFSAINLLGCEYWSSRAGDDAGRGNEKLDSALATLGLDLAPSISESAAGKQGKTYYVAYPTHTDKQRMLDWHLRKGVDRDQRHCLRIYFFWDSESNLVVVGWLPSHLDTASS